MPLVLNTLFVPGHGASPQDECRSGIRGTSVVWHRAQIVRPGIVNRDQDSPFTSEAFSGVLERAGIAISMGGRGRSFDNSFVKRLWRRVKHEDVSLEGYATRGDLTIGLTECFAFFNCERPHQGRRGGCLRHDPLG